MSQGHLGIAPACASTWGLKPLGPLRKAGTAHALPCHQVLHGLTQQLNTMTGALSA